MVIFVIPAQAGIQSRDVILLDSGLRRNDGKETSNLFPFAVETVTEGAALQNRSILRQNQR